MGFLPKCDLGNVSVVNSSRVVNFTERLSDICSNSSDNLFVIDVGICEGDDYVQLLCDMGFSRPDAIEALSMSGNDLSLTTSLLTTDRSQIEIDCDGANMDSLSSPSYRSAEAESIGQGCPPLQSKHGKCCFSGNSVCQDMREAARCFKMAVEQGDNHAQCFYALHLLRGGFPREDPVVARMVKSKADKGNFPAQVIYGSFLADGNCVPRDPEEARRYLEMASSNCPAHSLDLNLFGARFLVSSGIFTTYSLHTMLIEHLSKRLRSIRTYELARDSVPPNLDLRARLAGFFVRIADHFTRLFPITTSNK